VIEDGRLGSLTGVIAKLMEWPTRVESPTPSADWRTWAYLARFLVMGVLGVWGFLKVDLILARKKQRQTLGNTSNPAAH